MTAAQNIDTIKTLTDDQLISVFRQVRAKMEAAKQAFTDSQKPALTIREAIETEAKRRLMERGTTSFKSPHGTCYMNTQVSVTTKDKAAFFAYLQETDRWELADIRPAKKEIQNFAESTDGDLPPGVNYSQRTVAQFRAPQNK